MKCSATRSDGNPCQGAARRGSQWCFAHDPALAERRQRGAVKGGEGKRTAVRARKQFRGSSLAPADIHGLLSGALVKVADGEMEPGVGTALATMARALVSVQEAAVLLERVEELERAAGIEPANVTPLRRAG